MKTKKSGITIGIIIVSVGIAWILNVQGVIPRVDWLWTIGLAMAGVLSFVLGGVNKLSVIIGPFMLAGSVCSILRQTGRLTIDMEIPILTIALGILVIFVHVCDIRTPEILQSDEEEDTT